ncbi:MAG TPA: restriction endonuclease [Gemmataceae bacterium]|nr:restriction endonuclease [Gemmataceae bacterium]
MSKADDYIRMIRELADHAALMALWQRLLRNETLPGWDEGKAFEYLLLRAFEIEGAQVTWPYEVKIDAEVIEQIDGAVHLGHVSALVEAKDHEVSLNARPIAELRDKLQRRPPSVIGMVFSKRGFRPPAWTLARYQAPQRILLWTGDDITVSLARRAMGATLRAKYRYAVEHGFPLVGVGEEENR